MNQLEKSQLSIKLFKKEFGITILENNESLPFEIERVYYLYDVPSTSFRGGHAHHEQLEFLVALSGSFEVKLNENSSSLIAFSSSLPLEDEKTGFTPTEIRPPTVPAFITLSFQIKMVTLTFQIYML